MALNWNIETIKDFKELWIHDPQGHGGTEQPYALDKKTEMLIYATMSVGINEITKKNWKKFYVRLRMAGLNQSYNLGPKDILRHIGLHTNANKMTDAKFRKEVEIRFERELDSYDE